MDRIFGLVFLLLAILYLGIAISEPLNIEQNTGTNERVGTLNH